jgi:hypothetical protein
MIQLMMNIVTHITNVITPTLMLIFHTVPMVLSQLSTKQKCAKTSLRRVIAPIISGVSSPMATMILPTHQL